MKGSNVIMIGIGIALVYFLFFANKSICTNPILQTNCNTNTDCPNGYVCYASADMNIPLGIGNKCVNEKVQLENKICGGFANAKCGTGYDCHIIENSDAGVCYKCQ